MTEDFEDGVAYRIAADGSALGVDWRAGEVPRDPTVLDWVHLDLRSEVARDWLRQRSGVGAVVVDALLEDETRPRSVAIGNGLMLILRGVNLNPGADPEDMVALRLWVEDGLVISARRRPLMALRDLLAAVRSGQGPTSAGDLLVEIAGRLVERMEGVLSQLQEDVDAVEELLTEGEVGETRRSLTAIRRQAIALRRYLAPQREALARLLTERVPWLGELQRARLREVTDTTIRYVEDLEEARERTAVTLEELQANLAEQLNRRMYALSIVAGIFLPLGFVTGLLGINVGGMPGAENPLAFAFVCAGLGALGAGQVMLLRRLRWV